MERPDVPRRSVAGYGGYSFDKREVQLVYLVGLPEPVRDAYSIG